MKWRWWKTPAERSEEEREAAAARQARQAVQAADKALDEAERRGLEVTEASAVLRKYRGDNNFGYVLGLTMLPRKGRS